MNPSFIKLKSIEFLLVNISVANNDVDPVNFDFEGTTLTSGILFKSHEDNVWSVGVGFRIKPGDNKENPPPYEVDMFAVGFFEPLIDAIPKEVNLEKTLYESGAGIVYGAIREMVSTVTSRSAKGELMLPTPMFAGEYQKHLEREKASSESKEKTIKK